MPMKTECIVLPDGRSRGGAGEQLALRQVNLRTEMRRLVHDALFRRRSLSRFAITTTEKPIT